MSEGPEAQAWSELEEAVERFHAAMGDSGLLTDWVLVAHRIVAEADGSNSSTTSYVGCENQPNYRTLGLLQYASSIVKCEIEENLRGID